MTWSAKRISKHFGDKTGVWGEFIRQAMLNYKAGLAGVHTTLLNINAIIGAHGVAEVCEPNEDGTPNTYEHPIAAYVNTGGTYRATILYDYRKKSFHLTTWGDWYEKTPEYKRYAKAQAKQEKDNASK